MDLIALCSGVAASQAGVHVGSFLIGAGVGLVIFALVLAVFVGAST